MRSSRFFREQALDLFYASHIEGGKRYRWWGGVAGFFEPNIPSRLFGDLIGNVHGGLQGDINCLDKAIAFLNTSHLKKLSMAGRGQEDVICVPTEKGKEAASLLKKYKLALEFELLAAAFRS